VPSRRIALVTGASGQDGSYLCERLLADGIRVHALHHSNSGPSVDSYRWADRVVWHQGDITDSDQIPGLIEDTRPDEVYNLAGVTSVAKSWLTPVITAQVTGVGAAAMMDATWHYQERTGRTVRFVQASSAEIFGWPTRSPQTEETPIAPVSPYGAAKAYAHHMARVYRARGLGISTCILYNHESPRRPPSFVTRKITRAAASIALGKSGKLALGNLDATRDWGWAPDYVDAMVRSARIGEPSDYVIATGVTRTVRDFVAAAFTAAGVPDWEEHVCVDPALVRPADPAVFCGDATKARVELGWKPTVTFAEVVSSMVESDRAELVLS
jgi:GDPmannose 4,6-dehydratase